MNFFLRIGAAIFFGGFLVYVLRLVSKGKMLLKYSLLWILMCMAALLCDLFPQLIFYCSTAIGFVNPANFLFLGAIVIYPQKMPLYQTAFVFMDDGAEEQEVPPWAMKLVLDEEDLRGVRNR